MQVNMTGVRRGEAGQEMRDQTKARGGNVTAELATEAVLLIYDSSFKEVTASTNGGRNKVLDWVAMCSLEQQILPSSLHLKRLCLPDVMSGKEKRCLCRIAFCWLRWIPIISTGP